MKKETDYLFNNCEYCGHKLIKTEIEYCEIMYKKTELIHGICGNCLKTRFNGKFPAVSDN